MSDTDDPENAPAAPRVRLDTSRMKSSYCNVCNATSTAEEVVLNFGLNQNWDRQEEAFDILIEHRIILSPGAAARLRDLLSSLLNARKARSNSEED